MVHVESVWDENVFTLRGRQEHKRSDEPISRMERGLRVERALPVWSESLGLVGKCDVVEFHYTPEGKLGYIVPVEFKSGAGSHFKHAALQLCAQAMCLEEMFKTNIPEGVLFSTKTRQRTSVELSIDIRTATLGAVDQIRRMIELGHLPPAPNDRRCPKCSLVDVCLPQAISKLYASRSDPYEIKTAVALP